MTNTRENAGQLRPIHPNARILPFDFIDYDTDNKANALALQDAVFGNRTDTTSVPGDNVAIFSRLRGIHESITSGATASQVFAKDDILYRSLVTAGDINIGDIIRFRYHALFSQPGAATSSSWSNETTGALNITAPTLTDLVPLTVSENGQNVTRLVNSNTSTLQVKATNALIKSIYVDNLQAGIIYLDIFQGNAAAPVNTNIPLESYRVPSNGSTSIELDRVYTGQVWLAFSSTPGALTLSANNKNVIVRFN